MRGPWWSHGHNAHLETAEAFSVLCPARANCAITVQTLVGKKSAFCRIISLGAAPRFISLKYRSAVYRRHDLCEGRRAVPSKG